MERVILALEIFVPSKGEYEFLVVEPRKSRSVWWRLPYTESGQLNKAREVKGCGAAHTDIIHVFQIPIVTDERHVICAI
jgi:hypothetical protein